MYAVEFNAQAHNHFIRVPDEIPDGMEMRVLLLMREVVQKTGSKPISSIEAQLLENMTPHLAHADELVNPLKSEWSYD
jgi:hypothetical protein